MQQITQVLLQGKGKFFLINTPILLLKKNYAVMYTLWFWIWWNQIAVNMQKVSQQKIGNLKMLPCHFNLSLLTMQFPQSVSYWNSTIPKELLAYEKFKGANGQYILVLQHQFEKISVKFF